MSNSRSSPASPAFWTGALIFMVLAVIAFIVVLSGVTFVKTDGGHVAVVRNGGPFDNNKIKDVVPAASSRHYEGMYSSTHLYPASQRYYTIAASGGDRSGVDVFTSSTSDGVQVGIEGSVQFTFNTDKKVLSLFDDNYGTRSFPSPDSTPDHPLSYHVWDGDKGLAAFLDSVFRRQVLDNALRIEIQGTKCTDLIPSCVYVNTPASTPDGATPTPTVNGSQANANLASIQTRIKDELQKDLDATLHSPPGDHYINIESFTISKPSLSPGVQSKIDDANSAKVEVQRQTFIANQRVAAADGEQRANEAKAKGIKALNEAKATGNANINAITALCGATGCQNLQVLNMGGGGQNTLFQVKGK